MKNQKTALFTSLVSLLLCMAMLVGTTFAWFTDSVTSKGNKIAAGDLTIELYQAVKGTDGSYYTDSKVNWKNITDESDPLFDYDNWEPGYTTFVVLKVVNAGTLALDWHAELTSENTIGDLAEVINVYVNAVSNTDSATTNPFIPKDRDEAIGNSVTKVGTLKDFLTGLETSTYGTLKEGEEAYLTLVLQMDENAENKYQKANIGGDFDICIVATQAPVESDSFGSDYDENAAYCSHESVKDEFCEECGAYIRDTSATTDPTPTPDPDDNDDDDNDTDNIVMSLNFTSTGTTATSVDSSKVTVTGDAEYGTYDGRANAVALDNDDDITVDITSLYDSIKDGFTVSYWVKDTRASAEDTHGGWSCFIYNPANRQNNDPNQRKYIGILHKFSQNEGFICEIERGSASAESNNYNGVIGLFKTINNTDLNNWMHVVCTFDSNKTTFYINGEKVGDRDHYTSVEDLLKEESNLTLVLNKSQWPPESENGGEYLNAYYSDFAIYSEVLDATAVANLYNAQKSTTSNTAE